MGESSAGLKWGIIAVIIIGICVGAYFFVFAPAPKAEFRIEELEVSPSETYVGGTITVSAQIDNVGNAIGTYECTLEVNDVKVETKEVTLSAGETETVTFEISEDTEGEYSVRIGGKTATVTFSPIIFQGAYIEYTLKGFALIIPIEGTVRMEIVEITEDDFTVTMTATGLPGILKPKTETYPLEEEIAPTGPVPEGSKLVGEETISTAIGTRKVLHYYYYNVTDESETDYYTDKLTNLPLLMIGKGEGWSMEVAISDTNIKWLEEA